MTRSALEPPPPVASFGRRAALGFVFLWFLVGGLAHFAFTELEMRIVPPWVPGSAHSVVLVSGVFEVLGAAGLVARRTRVAAGWGLLALTVAVTPANVHMLQHAAEFPGVPLWALWLRLPLQLVLLGLIAWASGAWASGAWPRVAHGR